MVAGLSADTAAESAGDRNRLSAAAGAATAQLATVSSILLLSRRGANGRDLGLVAATATTTATVLATRRHVAL